MSGALFTTTSYSVAALIDQVALGKIGLPELQRPFVWPNTSVRNLLNSLYCGYPAGFLLFWETGADVGLKGIGANNASAVPKLAIVDGQQRLTSLYAVLKGEKVMRADFRYEHIQIAFNPLSERFAVTDAAIMKDKAYIPNISEIWRTDSSLFKIYRDFVAELKQTRDIGDEDEKKIEYSLNKLHGLPQRYHFVGLELLSSVPPETVAEVFVLINGSGKKLNQSDFIMTLMSVFWDTGRADLEKFSRQSQKPSDGAFSPYNHFIKPAPDQMLRATVGLSLKRARLEAVYAALRGRDAKTGLDNPAKRDEQFALMQEGQSVALDLVNWHHFLGALTLAGYRSGKMLSSETALIYSYVLYLVGVRDYEIKRDTMRQVIAEFFFMAALTGRYTNSPETKFDSDLSLLWPLENGAAFIAKLREICVTTLTGDYWAITLPAQMASSASRSPSLFAYEAALNILDATVLFSSLKVASLMDPVVNGPKSALELHHLFPRAHLADKGVKDIKKINQIGNFALIEWPENIQIGARAPDEYAPKFDATLSATERDMIYAWHALPPMWWTLPYEDFLVQRRSLMAKVVQKAWRKLTGELIDASPAPIAVADLIAGGETDAVEFKSTLRANLHTGQPDERMHLAALKSIAGFLNAKGGTLVIGIADNGDPIGIGADAFPNEDRMSLHLVNLIKDRIGDLFLPYVHPQFEDHGDVRVLTIRCDRGPKAAFVKDGQVQRFYVRGGNATVELSGNSITDYVTQRYQ